jgi:hypothetical protein
MISTGVKKLGKFVSTLFPGQESWKLSLSICNYNELRPNSLFLSRPRDRVVRIHNSCRIIKTYSIRCTAAGRWPTTNPVIPELRLRTQNIENDSRVVNTSLTDIHSTHLRIHIEVHLILCPDIFFTKTADSACLIGLQLDPEDRSTILPELPVTGRRLHRE